MRTMSLTGAICVLLCVTFQLTHCADANYDLHTIALTATSSLDVTLPAATAEPIYLTAECDWKQLEVARTATAIRFSLPDDALGSTVVLLNKPQWLTLPDTEPPVLEAVTVGGIALDVKTEPLNAGRFSEAPQSILLTVSDKLNPIADGRVQVAIDGQLATPGDDHVTVTQSKDGRHADITIELGKLAPDKHTVAVTLVDATPRHNSLDIQMAFSTAPLLLNGDFEAARPDDSPRYWRHAAWNRKPDTAYETTVAKDKGRSGNALKITGIAGNLYLIVGQQVEVQGGNTYVISGYYKTDGDDVCAASFYGKPAGELKEQYISSPMLPAAPDWTPFSWEFTAEQGHPLYEVLVWSKYKGDVYFDDLELQPKE
jgi:hypothetical protein